MYIVISNPKRISVALGVVHMLFSFTVNVESSVCVSTYEIITAKITNVST